MSYTPRDEEEAAFLASYDPSAYPRVELTVDIVVLTIRDGQLCVLLVRRAGFPYRGCWALPGGFVEPGESLDAAAERELSEETGLDRTRAHLEQLGTYGDPDRDPRARVVSVTYLAMLPDLDAPHAGSDADDARFWPVADLAEEGIELAFDHERILADGLERAKSKLEYTPLATAFCPPEFTIGQLRRVYETVWNLPEPLHAANFRRWVTSRPGFLIETNRKVEKGERSETGPRPSLFVAGPATILTPPLLRPEMRDHLGQLERRQREQRS